MNSKQREAVGKHSRLRRVRGQINQRSSYPGQAPLCLETWRRTNDDVQNDTTIDTVFG